VFLNRIASYPPGWGRCYVKLTNELNYTNWMRGQQRGHSFVTTGPMLEWSVNSSEPGEVLRFATPREVHVRARAFSQFPMKSLELIINGLVVSTNASRLTEREWVLDQDVMLDSAAWLTVRCSSA